MPGYSGKPTRRERRILKLSSEIAELEAETSRRRAEQLADMLATVDGEPGVNEAEGAFGRRAIDRGLTVHRHGWPDFLLVDPSNGETFAVEVKAGGDPVRANQARVFDALEKAGIRVYVWRPEEPSKLVPWRRFTIRQRLDGVERALVRKQRKLQRLD